MKKFLTVLLVIAVMFTFSFGSAFAVTGTGTASDVTSAEIAEFKAAIGQEAATRQGTLVTAGQNYMNSINFNTDDEVTIGSTTVSKAVLQSVVNDAVEDAQLKLSALAVKLQDNVTATNLANTSYDTIYKWKTLLVDGLSANTFGTHAAMDGYTALSAIGTTVEADDTALAKAQYNADLKAAQEKLAGYQANIDKYSDYTDDWYVMANEKDYAGRGYDVSAIAGITDAAVKVSAQDFVSGVVKTQLAAVNAAGASLTNTSTTANYNTAIASIAAAVKTAKEIVEGQKIDAAHNYYIAPVPTAEEIKADTTLDGAKATAIKQMKADLTAAAIKMETVLKNELSDENKNAKPDAKKVSDLTAAIAALDGQVAATEEVYTALINYCKSKTEIDTLTTTGGKKIKDGLDALAGVANYSDFAAAETELKANVVITENVDALEAEAALLTLQKDVNGQPLHNADALKAALEEQTENLYKGAKTLAEAKAALAVGAESALVVAKLNHINYISGIETTFVDSSKFTPKDKNGKEITATNFAGKKAWNKVYSTRGGALTLTVNGTQVVNRTSDPDDTVFVYDKAQRTALSDLIDETETAIKAAKTVAEVESIFAAAQEKYEDIATTADHEKDWAAGGKLKAANDKAGYGTQITNYASYLMSTVDGSKYGVVANDLVAVGNKTLYKAYTTDALVAQFAEAKTAMEAALKTKDEVKAAKAEVEKLIDAIGTVTIDSKDAIVAAADALDDYNLIAGTKLNVSNESKLITAKTDYEVLAAKALDDAFKALDAKVITVADAAAVEALRAQYDDYAEFCDDYGVTTTAKTNDDAKADPGYANSVQKLEAELSAAKVAAVREMMIKLPSNPTASQRAEVEAARAAYEALALDEQAQIVGTLPWRNLIDAEEALEVLNVYAVQALKIKASSTVKKGSITVKWTVKGDAAAADGYQIWKSTKKSSGYKKAFTTTKKSYKNTKGLKKGTRYYYKVRAYKVVDGKNVYSDWSNKAYRIAK